jgi:hypothetical protein
MAWCFCVSRKNPAERQNFVTEENLSEATKLRALQARIGLVMEAFLGILFLYYLVRYQPDTVVVFLVFMFLLVIGTCIEAPKDMALFGFKRHFRH